MNSSSVKDNKKSRFYQYGALIVACILISVYLVGSTITLKEPSGSTEGYWEDIKYIKNSNGKLWEATGSNIQLALWDLNSTSGGTVWLPSGTLNISTTIFPINNTCIVGAGQGSTIVELADNANRSMVAMGWNGISAADNRMSIGIHHVRIEGITFDGRNSSQGETFNQYAKGIGICSNSHNITIYNCEFKNMRSTMIWIYNLYGQDEPMSNIVVDTCNFDTIQRQASQYPGGVCIASSFTKVVNCNFKDTYACGVYFQNWDYPTYCQLNTVQGCTFTGRISSPIHFEGYKGSNNSAINNKVHDCYETAYVVSESLYSRGMVVAQNYSVVSGNHINGVTDFGIHVVSCGKCIISDNVIMNVVGGGSNGESGDAIYIAGTAPDNSFTGNVISDYVRYGLMCRSRQKIHDNTFINGLRGISVSSMNNVSIQGNVFSGQTNHSMMLYNIKDCNVIGNTAGSAVIGIFCEGTSSDYNIITNNNVRNCGTPLSIDNVTANLNSTIDNNIS